MAFTQRFLKFKQSIISLTNSAQKHQISVALAFIRFKFILGEPEVAHHTAHYLFVMFQI